MLAKRDFIQSMRALLDRIESDQRITDDSRFAAQVQLVHPEPPAATAFASLMVSPVPHGTSIWDDSTTDDRPTIIIYLAAADTRRASEVIRNAKGQA